jgi:hypothetical protein
LKFTVTLQANKSELAYSGNLLAYESLSNSTLGKFSTPAKWKYSIRSIELIFPKRKATFLWSSDINGNKSILQLNFILLFNLSQTEALATGPLRKRHGAERLGATQAPHARITTEVRHYLRKTSPRKKLQNLRQQSLADIHVLSSSVNLRKLFKYEYSKFKSTSK